MFMGAAGMDKEGGTLHPIDMDKEGGTLHPIDMDKEGGTLHPIEMLESALCCKYCLKSQ